MKTLTAEIFEIKRFAVHDGDGIRTTVFFKGCPLRCIWCHNPEGLESVPRLAYFSHKCIGCGECVAVCPTGAHSISDEGHIFDRKKCVSCGKCAENCVGEALTLYGKTVTVSDLLPMLLEDREFYQNSGGGASLSGGQCLMQADFCEELLKALKAEGISTAVDTCGFVSRSALQKVIPYTDVFLYDIKAFDEDVHKRLTGVSNAVILDNLSYLDSVGKAIEIRIPYVPRCNSDQMEKIAELLSALKNVRRVRVLPYHSYASHKYAALGIKNTLPAVIPEDFEITMAEKLFNYKSDTQ